MNEIKLFCTSDEMAVIVRALTHYYVDLENKEETIPASWFCIDNSHLVESIVYRIRWYKGGITNE